jgi:AP-2 complex subunit alpha
MAKIRKKFKEAGAKLSGYDRRKYVSKILYMYLLGYEPDFGYMEAINLVSSSKYAEKQMVITTMTRNCSGCVINI